MSFVSGDDRKEARELGCQWISRIRELQKSTCVRVFRKPLINFHAQKIEDLISMKDSNAGFMFVNERGGLVEMTEPSITADITDDELRRYVEVPLRTPFPCHSQSVERGVKLTSRSSKRVTGEKRQAATSIAVDVARTSLRQNLYVQNNG